jgi:hypothetical protein
MFAVGSRELAGVLEDCGHGAVSFHSAAGVSSRFRPPQCTAA